MISIPRLGLNSKRCDKRGNLFVLRKMDAKQVPEFMLKPNLSYFAEIDGENVSVIIHRSDLNSVYFKVIN